MIHTRLPKKLLTKGFTLIEMLVVIAIISILIGIGVNTFTIAQKKARDVRRKADLRAIQTALEAYKLDHNRYPYPSTCASGGNCYTSSKTPGYIAGLEPDYIPKLPTDPKESNAGHAFDATDHYEYTYGNVGYVTYGYDLLTRLENGEDPEACKNHPYYLAGGGNWCSAAGTPVAGGVYGEDFLYVLHNPQ